MNEVPDGVVEVVFGVMLTADHYEARRGQLEFRDGLLVGLRFGRHEQRNDAGLTVGLTLFPVPLAPDASAAIFCARAVTRVYSRGTLDSEAELGEVSVYANPSPA
jgi:hypothetical protein